MFDSLTDENKRYIMNQLQKSADLSRKNVKKIKIVKKMITNAIARKVSEDARKINNGEM